MKSINNQVNVEEMLEARDLRVAQQQALLRKYTKTLICFTMNIPGPVKVTPLVRMGFQTGCRAIQRSLANMHAAVLFEKFTDEKTGLEAFFVVDKKPREIKAAMVEIENADNLGRLMDIDVLEGSGEKVSREEIGMQGRLCLVCSKPAQECARSRAHSLEVLLNHVNKVLTDSILSHVGDLAEEALLAEVEATPKPGLVDLNNSGAHKDMNYDTFVASIHAIVPFLRQMAEKGITWEGSAEQLFLAIRPLGAAAEKAMFIATDNVNTHKGIIFSLGIVITFSMWYFKEHGQIDSEAILLLCGEATHNVLDKDFAHIDKYHPHTHGEKLYVKFGCKGIRGEVQDGFKPVRELALPKLRSLMQKHTDPNLAYIQTLLLLMSNVEDSNILIRTSQEMLAYAQDKAAELLQGGGVLTDKGLQRVWDLNTDFVAKNMSPGGSADLLIITIFMWKLEQLK